MAQPAAFGLNVDPSTGGLAIAGMGGPRRTPAESLAALSEAIDIIKASWAGQPYSFQGSVYSAPDVQPAPRPAHPVGLWLGVRGPRAVALAGEKADGWSVSAFRVPPGQLAVPLAREVMGSAAR